jgi:hypothetical protein
METGACQNSVKVVAPQKKEEEEGEENNYKRKKNKFNKQTYFVGE